MSTPDKYVVEGAPDAPTPAPASVPTPATNAEVVSATPTIPPPLQIPEADVATTIAPPRRAASEAAPSTPVASTSPTEGGLTRTKSILRRTSSDSVSPPPNDPQSPYAQISAAWRFPTLQRLSLVVCFCRVRSPSQHRKKASFADDTGGVLPRIDFPAIHSEPLSSVSNFPSRQDLAQVHHVENTHHSVSHEDDIAPCCVLS